MNSISKFGLYGLSVGLAAMFAGCSTEKITVDYVMPAKAITNVKSVNVAAIRVKANVTGSLAGDKKLNAGLVKQLLAMRLYKEGFYQVTDDIWSTAEGAGELEQLLKAKDSGHGYASLAAMGQGTEKVIIDLALDLRLDAKPVRKDREFTLRTVNYKVKPPKKEGDAPTSAPDPKATVVEKVKQPVTVYEVVAEGTLKAKFSAPEGKNCPEMYENTFKLSVPKSDRFDSAQPSQLKALAAVVSPAIDGIVADISPSKESRDLVASEGGDERVLALLNAKVFDEAITVVEKLDIINKANSADYENYGIALEATGDFLTARDAYAKAVKANPESETAKAGVKRIDGVLAAKKAVKASGAKQNKDTKFSK